MNFFATIGIISPGLGAAYLSTQDDEFDAQKDRLLALLGACLSLLLLAISTRHTAPAST